MFLKAIQMFGKVTGDQNVGGGVVSLYPSHHGQDNAKLEIAKK